MWSYSECCGGQGGNSNGSHRSSVRDGVGPGGVASGYTQENGGSSIRYAGGARSYISVGSTTVILHCSGEGHTKYMYIAMYISKAANTMYISLVELKISDQQLEKKIGPAQAYVA